MSPEAAGSTLSERLAHIRKTVYGVRGRAALARAIGVSPSTYNYYEKGRQPPADLLARAAEVSGASLTWLLTGAGQPFPPAAAETPDNTLSQHAREVLARFPAGGPAADTAAVREALRSILQQIERTFPQAPEDWHPTTEGVKPQAIPIVGRTAAGLPAVWEQFFAGQEDPDIEERLISRVEAKTSRQRGAEVTAPDAPGESGRPKDATALLIQLAAPTPDGVLEFLELPGLDPVAPGTLALRVDGDSMAPRILDGDIVVCHRDAPPGPGQTAVVKIRDRIGLTVKLWRPEGEYVHLIPINEKYEQARFRRLDILWACRVLWVVRT